MAASRPSHWWIGAASLAGACAIAFALAALLAHREAIRPVGEGELFVAETAEIAAIVGAGETDEAVRRARNEFEVEAVSVVDAAGTVTASTSATLVGSALEGMLAFAHGDGRLAAVAVPTTEPVEVDGVPTWEPGDTLYAVLRPVADGSILVHYDISGLLARRVQPSGLSGPALWLMAAAGVAVVAAGLLLVGRERAIRRYREAEREAELARNHSKELAARNVELDRARAAAERALALAEEKHRIRSEFVLMINHELRTPLTAVATGARLLDEPHLTEEDRAVILEGMRADADRLERIIDHVLAVARIENRGIESPVMSEPAEGILAEVGDALPKGTVVETSDPLGGLVLETDRQTLVHLLGSLADNAVTHGASTTRLVVGTEPPPGDVMVGEPPASGLFLSVVDDGPGIDPAFLPRAFEKFEKHGFSSGTGLGLYLVRLMAEAIGASISVSTGPDGTTMTVGVPASTVSETSAVPA